MLSVDQYRALLEVDEAKAFAWEHVPDEESSQRRLLAPRTNLGVGRSRFWQLLSRLSVDVTRGASIIDFGAFPGTALRIVRCLDKDHQVRLGAAGFLVSDAFSSALRALDTTFYNLEFDVRHVASGSTQHILTCPVDSVYDVAICTEVVEHQVYPLSLLVGINRFLRPGGTLYLTTNSVSFIGDVLKLVAGRHNIESIEQSHVLSDTDWRPHIRLYSIPEMKRLLKMTGFEVREAFYFDNGSVYQGLKGFGIGVVRRVSGVLPYLRSHMFVTAVKRSEPTPEAFQRLYQIICQYNLQGAIPLQGRE